MMNETILIVDDEKEIADLVEVYLKNEGYQVIKCYRAADAIASLQQPLSLAILDVSCRTWTALHFARKSVRSICSPLSC